MIPASIMGIYSFFSFLQVNSNASHQQIDDKLRIADLLWQEKNNQLLSVAQSVARDNTIILNYELGLYESLSEYGETLKLKNTTSLLYFFDLNGYVLSGDGMSFPAGIVPLIDQNTLKSLGIDGATMVFTVYDSNLYSLNKLNILDPSKPLTLLSLVPIQNYNAQLLGYIGVGLNFNNIQNDTQNLLQLWQKKIGAQVLLLRNSQIMSSSIKPESNDLINQEIGLKNVADVLQNDSSIVIQNKSLIFRAMKIADSVPDRKSNISSPIYLGIAIPENEFSEANQKSLFTFIFIIIIALLLTIFIGLKTAKSISQPIQVVAKAAREIEHGNFNINVPVNGRDEIGQMAKEFNSMSKRLQTTLNSLEQEINQHQVAEQTVRELNADLENRVQIRTMELREINSALADSLAMLRQTQKHLVETEKLAALGNLVSGLSHELNTPVGVCQTSITFLIDVIAQELQKTSSTENTSVLKQSMEVCQLVHQNLNRLNERISFFNQITFSGDEQSRVEIQLHDYIADVIRSYADEFSSRNIQCLNDIPQNLSIYINPGLLYQILSQIILNSCQHAFIGKSSGIITISVRQESDQLLFDCIDNGIGIDPKIIERIFEPFFTTQRGSGKSGLGLYVVHNLVHASLGGTITLTSDHLGTVVTFTVPNYIRLQTG